MNFRPTTYPATQSGTEIVNVPEEQLAGGRVGRHGLLAKIVASGWCGPSLSYDSMATKLSYGI